MCQVCRLEWNKRNKFLYAIFKYFNISALDKYYLVDLVFEMGGTQAMRLSLKPKESEVSNKDVRF